MQGSAGERALAGRGGDPAARPPRARGGAPERGGRDPASRGTSRTTAPSRQRAPLRRSYYLERGEPVQKAKLRGAHRAGVLRLRWRPCLVAAAALGWGARRPPPCTPPAHTLCRRCEETREGGRGMLAAAGRATSEQRRRGARRSASVELEYNVPPCGD